MSIRDAAGTVILSQSFWFGSDSIKAADAVTVAIFTKLDIG